MSMVGNQTNSQDPQALNSRVFVGNLNTFQCTKGDLERIFQRYGRIAGISMHRGYAFIQFTNQFDAKSSCQGEDGRTVLGQTLDVNLVTEPKPHQIGKKKPNHGKVSNDWDYFYDSYYASSFLLGLPTTPQRASPAAKRPRMMEVPRMMSTGPRLAIQTRSETPTSDSSLIPASEPLDVKKIVCQLKTYSNPDLLICGNCRELFSEIGSLLEHKKDYCKMRFLCKCATGDSTNECRDSEDKAFLICTYCNFEYKQAWEFLQHLQTKHDLKLFELKTSNEANGSRSQSPKLGERDEEEKQVNASVFEASEFSPVGENGHITKDQLAEISVENNGSSYIHHTDVVQQTVTGKMDYQDAIAS